MRHSHFGGNTLVDSVGFHADDRSELACVERCQFLLLQVLAIGVESVPRLQQFDDICPRFEHAGAIPTHVVGSPSVPSRSSNTHVLCPFWVHIVLRYLHHYGKCGVELLVQKQPHAERGGPGRKPPDPPLNWGASPRTSSDTINYHTGQRPGCHICFIAVRHSHFGGNTLVDR